MYNNIKKISEVTSGGDFNDSAQTEREVNAHLAEGWTLLDIHKRGWDDVRQGESAIYTTVYILGHTDPEAPVVRKR